MIIGLIEHERGKLNPLSLEMLTVGWALASQLSVPLHAVLIGDAARPLVDQLAAYGVSTVHLAQHELLDDYAPEAWAQSVVELISGLNPQVVMAAGSDRGNEVMAHVAARTNLPLAANCTAVQPGDSCPSHAPALGGKPTGRDAAPRVSETTECRAAHGCG